MSNLLSLTSNQLKRAAAIKDQIESLNQELAGILGGAPVASGRGAKKGGMSAAGRARVAAAQRARWAKVHAAKGTGKPAGKKKSTMSAAAKAKMAAAAKARWAKVRAAKSA